MVLHPAFFTHILANKNFNISSSPKLYNFESLHDPMTDLQWVSEALTVSDYFSTNSKLFDLFSSGNVDSIYCGVLSNS